MEGDSKVNSFVEKASQAQSPEAIIQVIIEATEQEGLFVFGELLASPKVEQLNSEEKYKKIYELLEIFAFGTYKDYLAQKNNFPALNQAQIRKLQKLTIASVSAEQKVLPYERLLTELNIEMGNIRELENLLIESIYDGIIKGKLDQTGKRIFIEFAISRDLKKGELDDLINLLQQWESHAKTLLSNITSNISFISSEHEVNAIHAEEVRKLTESRKHILEIEKENKSNKRKKPAEGDWSGN